MRTNKEAFIGIITDKINTLAAALGEHENNKNPNWYKNQKDLRLYTIIKDIIERNIPKDVDTLEVHSQTMEWLNPANTNGGIVVHEGDNISDLLVHYKDVKDAGTKITKALNKAGLTIDYANGGKIIKI